MSRVECIFADYKGLILKKEYEIYNRNIQLTYVYNKYQFQSQIYCV